MENDKDYRLEAMRIAATIGDAPEVVISLGKQIAAFVLEEEEPTP